MIPIELVNLKINRDSKVTKPIQIIQNMSFEKTNNFVPSACGSGSTSPISSSFISVSSSSVSGGVVSGLST